MKWNKKTLEEFLKGKEERSVDINEYLLLIKFINKIKPDVIIDIGTYLGSSGYILGTCCDSIKKIYSIDNIDSPNYYPKEEAEKEEHGKHLPEHAIFLTHGYENGVLEGLIQAHPNAFVFWDAGKNSIKVLDQVRLSHKNKIKYIAFHDSNVKSVRRVIKRITSIGMYEIIEEDIESCPKKGVTILKLK